MKLNGPDIVVQTVVVLLISECIFALVLVSINCVKALLEYKIVVLFSPQVDF